MTTHNELQLYEKNTFLFDYLKKITMKTIKQKLKQNPPPQKTWLLLQPWDRKQKIGMVKSKLYT